MESVSNPKLTKAPLASPGQIITLSRGGLADHLRTSGKQKHTKTQREPAEPKTALRSKPRPSRKALDLAEAAIAEFDRKTAADRAALDKREAELLKERKALNARHRREADKLEGKLDQAKEAFDKAMERWRAGEP